MAACPHCGKTISDNAAFCTSCGKPMAAETPPRESAPPPSGPPVAPPTRPPVTGPAVPAAPTTQPITVPPAPRSDATCVECGKPLPQGASTCPTCGTATHPTPVATTTAKTSRDTEWWRKPGVLAAGGAALLAVAVAAGLWIGLQPSGDDSAVAAETTTTTATANQAATTTTTQPSTATAPTEATPSSVATTAANTEPPSEFDADVALVVDFYRRWSDAVAVGQAEIEGYLEAHLYPDLPRCAPGEKTLPVYSAQRDSIRRADDWAISWGPLDGVRPNGRVYEVQLEELDSPSHVAILNGVAYVFWNCKGDVPTAPAAGSSVWYSADPPTYFPAPLPGAGDYFGSGCSPGTASLPDGIWYGHVESASNSTIEFDLVCFAPTPAGEDGVGRFTNNSDKLRTVRVGPGATVHAVAVDGGWEIQPYSVWRLDPGEEGFCPPGGCWTVWLYVNNGEVTEIVQLWFA